MGLDADNDKRCDYAGYISTFSVHMGVTLCVCSFSYDSAHHFITSHPVSDVR